MLAYNTPYITGCCPSVRPTERFRGKSPILHIDFAMATETLNLGKN